jgi:hypothetical protein
LIAPPGRVRLAPSCAAKASTPRPCPTWRRQRDAGALGALSPGKRGPKIGTSNPLTIEVAQLQRTNARLTQRLARAEAIIEIQKKVAALLGMPLTSKDDAP